MAEMTYLGAIMGKPGNYGILFPDFLGCISAGDTLDDVRVNGAEALQFHIEGMQADGEAIPVPTRPSLAQVAADFFVEDDPEPDNWIELHPIAVNVADTVSVSLKAELVRKIAEQAGRITAQKFVEDAVRHELERLNKSAA